MGRARSKGFAKLCGAVIYGLAKTPFWRAFNFCSLLYLHQQTKKTITVFSVEGVGIRDLAGEAFDFLRRSIHLISEHYPERSVRLGRRGE